MSGLLSLLSERLVPAFDALESGADPTVRRSDRADFQANGALALGKRLGRNPRDIAGEVVAKADLDGYASTEIAGPGFVNLVLAEEWLAGLLVDMSASPRLGVEPAAVPHKVVVDYSSPNAAKQLAVHHIRSTIIGDSICRMLAFAGHEVVRANHLGDWGTQFGMLIEHVMEMEVAAGGGELSIADLEDFYRDARTKFDGDPGFAERARSRVVSLQSGDEETLRLWAIVIDESKRHLSLVYGQLGVLLTEDDFAGESMYNDMLQAVVDDLDSLGLLVVSDGARCVFPPGFTNREGGPLPLIVQKTDGGFGYTATDLAALRYRAGMLGADLLLYVVGAPQSEHLAMCFAAARMARWLPDGVEALHIPFGSVLGPDHKILRTRSGGTVRLDELLDEAISRATAKVAETNPGMEPLRAAAIAEAVGIGAVKYGDLSTDRIRDEVFDWERMLSVDGNTAPYLQYAHARICSILRKAEAEGIDVAGNSPPHLATPAERELAIGLLSFEDALWQTLETYSPHRLCTYLFELAGTFTSFYESCPVLKAPDEETRASRLFLCRLMARVLERGLDLLGIAAPTEM
ncbi:MAG TPA: arginine--tRNA ligase [Acidimicrobiales bacterium]|nr:arginine--tRNA ligase [Acidimicrobiales bacterium]